MRWPSGVERGRLRPVRPVRERLRELHHRHTMGGSPIHKCGAQAVTFCRSANAASDKLLLLARPQCELAGRTRAEVTAG